MGLHSPSVKSQFMVAGHVPGKHSNPHNFLLPARRLQPGLLPDGALLVQSLS